ncbi:histidine kinase [Lachnospiraceae bacterium 54-53]
MAALCLRLKLHYYRNSLRMNMLLIFIPLFTAVTLPSLLLLRHFNKKSILENTEQMAVANLSLSETNLLHTLDGAGKISTSLLSNHSLQSFLKTPPQARDGEDIAGLEYALYSTCATSPSRLSAYLYPNGGGCYYSDSQGMKRLIPGGGVFEPVYRLDGKTLCTSSSVFYGNTPGLSVARVIKSLDTLQPLGILVVNISLEDISAAFSDNPEISNSYFLLDGNLSPVLDGLKDSFSYGSLTRVRDGSVRIRTMDRSDTSYLLCYKSLENYPFTIGMLQQLHAPASLGLGSYLAVLLLFFINMLLITVGIFLVSLSLIKPITALAEMIRNIHKKDFQKIRTRFESTNEIGYLAFSYNEMTDQIQELLKKELLAEKYRRQLELSLLQAQFKPHFLYNTLDNARMLCLSGDGKSAASLLKAIGIYYQTILSKGQKLIPIEYEVDSIRQYETILSFQDSYEALITYEVEDEVKKFPILKFILQPLVENCLKHGLYGLDDGTISIAVRIEEEDVLYLHVADNGRGMDRELIDKIMEKGRPDPSRSFGLAATVERMELFYGKDLRFSIESAPGKGTKVAFWISHFSAHTEQENPL